MFAFACLVFIFSFITATFGQCPSDGRMGPNNRCYAAFNSSASQLPILWTDAEAYCGQHQGHLASIHNTFVNNFLWNWSKDPNVGSIWIGLYCGITATNSHFNWSDSTAYDYKNWVQPEPMDCTQSQNLCAYMQVEDGRWTTTRSCLYGVFSFICEF